MENAKHSLSVHETETSNGPKDVDSLVNNLAQDYASFLEVDESNEVSHKCQAFEKRLFAQDFLFEITGQTRGRSFRK